MRWFVGLLIACLSGIAAQAESTAAQGAHASTPPAPATNRWHVVRPGSPFHTADTPAQRMAGLLQEDGLFARLILGAEDKGAYATVAVPGDAPTPRLRSELVFANGARMHRQIAAPALESLAMPGAGLMIYSFAIAPEDLPGFRRASQWVLTPENGPSVTLTLAGSADAIEAARAHMPMQVDTDAREMLAPVPRPDIRPDTGLNTKPNTPEPAAAN